MFNLATFAAFAASVAAVPLTGLPVEVRQSSTVTDADILQYALTLEHLENAFYTKALQMWPETQFIAEGGSAELYNNLKYIAHDETSHVQYLEAGLTAAGATPVAACTYNFQMETPADFIKLASIIEGLGVSAYLGGAPLISSKAYLTAAGSILVTEALHQSYLRAETGEVPMASPYGTPLGLNPVYTVASGFITACPSTNAKLPVMAYPSLTLVSGEPTASGALVYLKPASAPTGTFYITVVSGLSVTSSPATYANGMVSGDIPMMVEGQSYLFLTSSNGTASDADILAGPAIIEATPSSPTFSLVPKN